MARLDNQLMPRGPFTPLNVLPHLRRPPSLAYSLSTSGHVGCVQSTENVELWDLFGSLIGLFQFLYAKKNCTAPESCI